MTELWESRPTIHSESNEKVKYVRSLARRRVREKEGRFIVESIRVLEDGLRAGRLPALVFFTERFLESERGRALLERVAALTPEVYRIGEGLLKALTETVTPQGILAVMPVVQVPAQADHFLLVLDGIQDPGNLGTLLRSAEAAGVDEVILGPGTVDVYNPKVVRAGAGVHFRLPIRRANWGEIAQRLKAHKTFLAEEGSPRAYYEVDWTGRCALIVGNEGIGPSDEARRLATERVAVPMRGGTDSLNVAVAGSVILFEAARQRRVRPDMAP